MKNNFPKFFSLIVGTLMILMWLFFIISGSVPEIETSPWEISLHLAAEFLTAISLIISAVLSIKDHKVSKSLMLLSHGMLIYTLVVSPGYYAQIGDFSFVAMFGILLFLTVLSVFFIVTQKKK